MINSVLMVLTFIIGVGVGMGVYYAFFRASPQEKRLEEDLTNLQHEFRDYRFKVSNHLNQTVELVNGIGTNFDRLQDHILQASVTLNLDDHKQSILQPDPHAVDHLEIDDEQVTEFHPSQVKPIKAPRPPKDYA